MRYKLFSLSVYLIVVVLIQACASSKKIVREPIKQNSVVQNFDLKKVYNDQELNRKVKLLIEQLLNKNTQQSAVDSLINLEPSATPYIIMNMDDYRQLPDRTITLVNKSPNAFESHRFAGVRKVTDALSEILSQREGKVFTRLSIDDITDKDRAKDINAWKSWLFNRYNKSAN